MLRKLALCLAYRTRFERLSPFVSIVCHRALTHPGALSCEVGRQLSKYISPASPFASAEKIRPALRMDNFDHRFGFNDKKSVGRGMPVGLE